MSAPDILLKGAREIGFELSEKKLELFMLYLSQLKVWNEKINLTAVKTDRDIIIKHFLDSLTPAEMIGEQIKLLDIGSGAGFPGVPLKIVRPDLDVTLLESSGKKVLFLKDLIRKLGLKKLKAVSLRAEDAKNGLPRHSFDCVITRAVGSIQHVLELSLPYIKEDGHIILMRGRTGVNNIDETSLGKKLKLMEDKSMTLPYGGQERRLLVFRAQ
jgi:16S rRNA (guanine527-N7)-methyltransferase